MSDDLTLDIVYAGGRDIGIGDAVTDGQMERTMEGASTLTLNLHDPKNTILQSKDLQRAIDLQFRGTWWRLVKLSKAAMDLTLTFEDRNVAYLRGYNKPRKVSRGKMTRAQFVQTLAREVKETRIDFVCPELSQKQPIGKATQNAIPTATTTAAKDTSRGKGISGNVKVSGARATPEQIKNAQQVLDVADQLGAGPLATLALMEAVIVESSIKNLPGGDRDSVGILQVRASTSPVGSSIQGSCEAFLKNGFWGKGGAIDLAKQHPDWSAGKIAQTCQGSAFPDRYDQHKTEAQNFIDANGGAASSTPGGGAGKTGSKKYEFSRGSPGQPETSWDAIQRLATEVKWRSFIDNGKLYFISEDQLMASRARTILTEDTPGVATIDFDFDTGKPITEITVTCRAELFDPSVGTVVALDELGFINGRYLVLSVSRGLFDANTTVKLVAPTKKLPEPAGEAKSSGAAARAAAAGESGVGASVPAGSLRERIVAVAEASRESYSKNPGAWFYSQSGSSIYQDPTVPPKPGTRSDCSQWVGAVFKKAGAPGPFAGGSYIGSTFDEKVNGHVVPLSEAKPGDVIVFADHTEIYVGPGKRTIGHGTAEVNYGTYDMMPGGLCWRYYFLDPGSDSRGGIPTGAMKP